MPETVSSGRPQASRDGRRRRGARNGERPTAGGLGLRSCGGRLLTTSDGQPPQTTDWVAWHADYDTDSPLKRRLAIVQRHIVEFLASFDATPVRVVSMCAGEARDLLGALAKVERRDICGRLVELDPGNAAVARGRCDDLGLTGLEVLVGDAGRAQAYADAVPADLVLACGVFGNISDADVERTVGALPAFCAPGATVIWTRHRREPDLTPAIRQWFADADFHETAFVPVPSSEASVGVARYVGSVRPLADDRLFTFIR